MKNTNVEKKKLETSKKITIGALTATTAALTVTAVFKKETRKAILAGMVTGVATPFIAKAVAKKVEQSALGQAVKAELVEKYEEAKIEAIVEILSEDSDNSESSKDSTEVVEQETVDTVSIKEFEEYREMVSKAMSNLIDNMQVLDKRTISQNDEMKEFGKLLNDTVKDISKTYIGISKEVKAINKEVKALGKDDKAVKEIKEYLDENRKMILEELGIKGSDLIANLDIEKFSEQAAQATANEMATTVMGQVGEVMTKAIRQEIKDTGLAKELDEVKAFIEQLKEGNMDEE